MGVTVHSYILQASAEAAVSGFPKSNNKGLGSTVMFSGSDLLFHCCYLAQSLYGKDLAVLCGKHTLQLHILK